MEVAPRATPFPELLQREVREDFGLAFCKSRRLVPALQNTFAGAEHLFTQKRSNSRHRHRRWRLMPRREDRHFACFAFALLATPPSFIFHLSFPRRFARHSFMPTGGEFHAHPWGTQRPPVGKRTPTRGQITLHSLTPDH